MMRDGASTVAAIVSLKAKTRWQMVLENLNDEVLLGRMRKIGTALAERGV